MTIPDSEWEYYNQVKSRILSQGLRNMGIQSPIEACLEILEQHMEELERRVAALEREKGKE